MVANECRWWRLLTSIVRNSTDSRKRIRMLWKSWQTYLHSRVTFETHLLCATSKKEGMDWVSRVHGAESFMMFFLFDMGWIVFCARRDFNMVSWRWLAWWKSLVLVVEPRRAQQFSQ